MGVRQTRPKKLAFVPIIVVQGTLEMTTAGGPMQIAIGAWDDQADNAGTLMLISVFVIVFN
jgi:hypothetical protein